MSGEAILIVEDNEISLKLVKILLTVEGYQVMTATDATEALVVLEKTDPKLILMDLQLPGMDGLTLTRLLKSNPKYQHIIILAMTAYAMKGDKEKALAAGCDGYIPKPIDTQSLPGVLANYLQAKKEDAP